MNLKKINNKETNLIKEVEDLKKSKDFKEKDLIGNLDNIDNKIKYCYK